ncbi:hypothetical protein PVAND_015363 [Polypedilum vanderplanki]|uniref:Uncharacterized protein n=1 Tax=Polypedilum vanderplanki TaxID=319348 RepID=A0A9J6BCD9_POLVA|nr:hypothetical protein PVAND_015363 [Polypedilum vanderplanki]
MKKYFCILIFEVIKISTAFTINCIYSSSNGWQNLGAQYTCETTNIPESLGNTVTSVTGVHQVDKTNADVKVVYIQGNRTLSFFPRNFIQHFPNMIGIGLQYTTMESINGDEIEEYGDQLVWFVLGRSNLKEIPSNFFTKTPNVVTIFFSENQIERVGNGLFSSLDVMQLRYVDFSYNNCIHQSAGYSTNQIYILELIANIHIRCYFDDQNLPTTTESSNCNDENIEEFVCHLEEKVGKIENNLSENNERLNNLVEEIQNLKTEMNAKDERIKNLENEIEWILEFRQCAANKKSKFFKNINK